jgi:hypothetical protein
MSDSQHVAHAGQGASRRTLSYDARYFRNLRAFVQFAINRARHDCAPQILEEAGFSLSQQIMAFQSPRRPAYPLLKGSVGRLTGVLNNASNYERAGIACIPARFFSCGIIGKYSS